jgi:hypothetical protein
MFRAGCHILSCWSWIRHVPAGEMFSWFNFLFAQLSKHFNLRNATVTALYLATF